jgi:hypothetical protein
MSHDRAACRQHAEACRREAEQTTDLVNKARWLKIAEVWTVMALTEEPKLSTEAESAPLQQSA